jgi:hypothetical protein
VTPELPATWKRNFDLFEIGFVFFFLPIVVSTMDRPPLHLGGLILLWVATWFLLREKDALLQDLKKDWSAFRLPWSPLWVASLAAAGGLGASHGRWILGCFTLPFEAVAFSLPLCLLAFRYAPRRFAGRGWAPIWLTPFLPPLLFAGLHLASGSWRVVLAAFAGGWILVRVPLWAAVAVHAMIWWFASSGGLW